MNAENYTVRGARTGQMPVEQRHHGGIKLQEDWQSHIDGAGRAEDLQRTNPVLLSQG